jgi:hypothetical protein
MRIGRCLVAVVLAAGLTAPAAADEPRKPGATGIFVPGAGRDLTLALLTQERLQDDLKLTPEQREKLKPLAENHDAAQKAWRTDRRDPAKKKAATTAHQAAQAETQKAVAGVLTAEQDRRLAQIERQVAGLGAFMDDTNAKELKLTDGQRARVREISLKRLRAGAEAGRGSPLGIADATVLKKLDEAAAAELDAVLTDGQKRAWKELLGEPFDTTGFQFQAIAGRGR